MTLATTRLDGRAGGDAARPLLILGPSLGTAVEPLWSRAARMLSNRFDVVGVDLPGHGHSPVARDTLSMPDLAGAVLDVADDLQARRGDPGAGFFYAGVSVAGCIGVQLAHDAPQRLRKAVILNSAPRIGDAQGWQDRAALVARDGVGALRETSAQRWFAPGFAARDPETAATLLRSLMAADPVGYRQVCGALARFDLRDRLDRVTVPLLVIGGEDDIATPPACQRDLAQGVRDGRAVILPGVGHLAPAEAPEAVAQHMAEFLR